LYALGRKLGADRLRDLVERHGRWLLLRSSDLDRGQAWFRRHGDKAVLLGRLVPTVRSLISIPAGAAGMSFGRFLVYTTLGSGAWNALLVGLGYVLGERWSMVDQYAEALGLAVAVACALGVAWFVWRRVAGRVRQTSGGARAR
jgi:membrane protein DedA with SNARE-associated domain